MSASWGDSTQKKTRPWRAGKQNPSCSLWKMLDAAPAVCILPVLLDQEIDTAKDLVKLRSVGCGLCRAEIEVALVGIFFASTIKPGIQVRIRDRFLAFMGNHVGHAIRAAYTGRRTIGSSGLSFAARGTAVRVADEGVFDVRAIQSRARMKAAVLGAET